MTKTLTDRVFTLEIEGQPIVAFAADSHGEAEEIRKEGWILEKLKRLKSGGTALWDARASVTVRSAQSHETLLYWQVAEKVTVGPDELILAYLVEIDEVDDNDPVEPGAFPPCQ